MSINTHLCIQAEGWIRKITQNDRADWNNSLITNQRLHTPLWLCTVGFCMLHAYLSTLHTAAWATN